VRGENLRKLLTIGTVVGVVWATAGSASPAPSTDHPPGAPTRLTVDDDPAPLAVTGAPAFGWMVNDPDRGETQKAYELVVTDAPTAQKHNVVFDSGSVTSNQQAYVEAPTVRLAPDHTYWWTVRTQDASGQFGPYSAEAHFDTGLGDADWDAAWIRRSGTVPKVVQVAGTDIAMDDFALIRKEMTVSISPVVRARVYAAAGQQYELHVNGTRAAVGPSYSYPSEQYYETTDVTRLVRAGASNAFAFVTHWATASQGRPDSPEAFIAHISIDHADGTRQVLTTDGSWRTRTAMWIPDGPRNDEGDLTEHIDERLVPTGWDEPGFDDHAWPAAVVLGRHPWLSYSHLVAARTHIVFQPMKPVRLKRLADGSYVADFGAVTSATPVVDIRAGVAGRAVKLVAGDALDPNGHVSTTVGHQDTDMHWDFTERVGAQELRPFDYLAFRYLEVDGAAETLDAAAVTIAARHTDFPDEHAASFATSDPAIDAVWNLARHSALNDAQEQFLDTPTREKGAFLTDSYDVSQAAMAAFGERMVTSQMLTDFAHSQKRYWPDGRVNAVYPNGDGKRDIPDSTENYVQWVWKYWMASGDRNQLAALYPVVRNIAGYLANAIDPKTGLVTNLPGGGGDYAGGMVDWPPQMRYGYDMSTTARTTLNIVAVDDFRRVAAIAQALGRPASESAALTARADALTSAIRKLLERPNGVFVDGLLANGTPSAHVSQQANAFALGFGIVPAAHVPSVVAQVVGAKSAMGVINYRVLLDAMHNGGRDDALVTDLTDPNRPGYAQILKEGATFTWESWDARQVGDSESHGWGATVLSVLQDDVLGARVTAPGGAEITVAAPKSSITKASGVVTTQRGPVAIAWTRTAAGGETIDATVPANMTATVHLSGTAVGDVSENSRAVTGDPGISNARAAQGEVVMTVGSGHYSFANTKPTVIPAAASTATSTSHTGLFVGMGVAAAVVVVALVLFGALRRRRRAA
jgi:alpha-L-rhamnosidase